jgi:hypothetical protein
MLNWEYIVEILRVNLRKNSGKPFARPKDLHLSSEGLVPQDPGAPDESIVSREASSAGGNPYV